MAADTAGRQQAVEIQSTVPVLNIRSRPGLNAGVVGKLTASETSTALEVLEKWVKIRKSDGTEGFVFKEYTAVIQPEQAPEEALMPDPPSEKPVLLTATVPVLNIRSRPGLNADVVGKLTASETSTVLEVLEAWVKIRKSDGTEGFVFKQYARLSERHPEKRSADQKTNKGSDAGTLQEDRLAGADTDGTGDPALDDVLSGFDDGGTSADGLDGVLAGFDGDGETSGDLGDVLSGFEDETSSLELDAADTTASPWDVGGSVKLSTVFNVNHDPPEPGWTDHRGLSRMRSELDLQIDRDIYHSWKARVSGRAFYDFAYAIQGRDNYTSQVLDVYEDEAEIREAYVQGSLLPSLDLKVGRQIVVWGRSENFRVTDVLNPVDSRTPGLVDIEDIRLPVCMTRLDYYTGAFSITGIAIPEIRFNKMPVVGNDFYPLNEAQPGEVVPSPSLANTELAMAIKGIFHGWDASLYGAYLFDDDTYYELLGYEYTLVDTIPLPGGGTQPVYEQDIVAVRRHARLYMVGGAANVTTGSWLFKTELSYTDGYRYTSTEDEKGKLRWLVGLEYSGLKNTTVSLDLLQTWVDDFEPAMKKMPDYAVETQFEAALRVSRTFLRERLELVFFGLLRGGQGEDGAFERLSASYDFTDRLTGGIGALFYQDGDSITYDNIHDNNRVYADLTYNF
ncbi:SH3 type 3 domain protein [Desulfosudis oleivorans Hxd3]|uniref:SH3 type 3 domain protein n=2 Tax=Desulfosudis TaxID=2904716 RepID=A8ZXB3_DESOH|nr:SH3 type 3 domain protein [Desulfosudis oleivorans Hxd3]